MALPMSAQPPGRSPFASIDVFHTNMRTLSTSSGESAVGISIFVLGSYLRGSVIQLFAHS